MGDDGCGAGEDEEDSAEMDLGGGIGSGPHHWRTWHDQAQKSRYGLQGRTALAFVLGIEASWVYKGWEVSMKRFEMRWLATADRIDERLALEAKDFSADDVAVVGRNMEM